ncbi:MAG: hypothetical protein KIT80_08835 [Chitinophagaceae bacterium]|nr:hypothetical protein [Chitinophagaceae bacterium]
MKKIFTRWFTIFVVVFVAHQLLQKVLKIPVPVADSYLDAFLFMPILLHLILWERRLLFKKGESYTLSYADIFILFVVVSIVCEYFFPKWNKQFTVDFSDVICYLAGATLFALFFNKPAR